MNHEAHPQQGMEEKSRQPPWGLRDSAAIFILLLFLAFLLAEPLAKDRVLLSFDTRLWPPYMSEATPEMAQARMNMIYSDLPCWMAPQRILSNRMMDEGTPPLWTPYTAGGMPLLAALAYPVYYPVNLVLRFLEVEPLRALAWQTLINLWLAGLGMYLFLRLLKLGAPACLLGALTLCASAWYVTHIYIPLFLNGAAWIPLMFWAAEGLVQRKAFGIHALLLAFFTGFSVLGGFPQVSIIALYGAGLWVCSRAWLSRERPGMGWKARSRPVAAFVLAAVAGLCLSTIQLLPTMEYKSQSLRAGDYPLSYYKEHPLEAPSLLGQWVPGLFGNPVDPEGGGGRMGNLQQFLPTRLFLTPHDQNNFMENSLSVGVLPFLLALCALGAAWRRSGVRIFLVLSLLAVLAACGTWFLDLFYTCLPGFKVGNPKRLLVLHAFALAGLAAFGLDSLRAARGKPMNRYWTGALGLLGLAGILALTLGFSTLSGWIGSWWTDSAAQRGVAIPTQEELDRTLAFLRSICWPAALAPLALSLLRGFAHFKPKSPMPILLLVAACALEVGFFSKPYIVSQPLEGQYPQTAATDFLVQADRRSGLARMVPFGNDRVLVANMTALHGIQSVSGHSACLNQRYGEYCHALDPALVRMVDPRYVATLGEPDSLASPMLDLLGVRFVAAGSLDAVPHLERQGFSLVFREDREGVAFFENPEALPRAFAVTACVITGGAGREADQARQEALALVSAPDFAPASTVVLEAPLPDGFAPCPDPEGRAPEVTLERYEPLEVTVRARMHGSRGLLVLTDNYFPGWKAEVDGRPAPLLLADYTFRAVPLSEGDHTVVFRYEPDSRKRGIYLSLASLTLLLLAAAALLVTRKRTDPV